jgi:hypothetical protein
VSCSRSWCCWESNALKEVRALSMALQVQVGRLSPCKYKRGTLQLA